jgi:hypothetical protein
LFDYGDHGEAIAAFRQAIAIDPDFPEAYINLGTALQSDEKTVDQAIAAYRQAIALRSDFPEAHNNLGTALQAQCRLDEAVASYRQAIALQPNLPRAHLSVAFSLLARQDFLEGWEEYEWRWKCDPSPQRTFVQPQWDGSPLQGRTLGDNIQFIRFLPLIAARMESRCGKIIVECQAQLVQLVATIVQTLSPSICERCEIITRGQPLPPFDLHCPLLSLPRAFKTAPDSIPAKVPYLFPAPPQIDSWRQRVNPCGPWMDIGIAWAGSPTNKRDRVRSISLKYLALLAESPRTRFFNLQKGPAAAQAKSAPAGFELIDWTDQFNDFHDTAAFMANLDLVITVDTSIAHLAGALGRPVWVMLPFTPDWRWQLDRSDSPWYPTMRLFRQSTPGDWAGVIRQVVDALSDLIKNRS